MQKALVSVELSVGAEIDLPTLLSLLIVKYQKTTKG